MNNFIHIKNSYSPWRSNTPLIDMFWNKSLTLQSQPTNPCVLTVNNKCTHSEKKKISWRKRMRTGNRVCFSWHQPDVSTSGASAVGLLIQKSHQMSLEGRWDRAGEQDSDPLQGGLGQEYCMEVGTPTLWTDRKHYLPTI